jgi:hypothetical protein
MLMLILLVCVGATMADDFEISRSTIDGGGTMRTTGGTFELSGTIGQPDAGKMSGGDLDMTGGFWFALAPTDCNEDGGVSLLDYETFVTCLTGPAASVISGCECFDVNRSGTVDMRDFTGLQVAFTGS